VLLKMGTRRLGQLISNRAGGVELASRAAPSLVKCRRSRLGPGISHCAGSLRRDRRADAAW
jgi:hypothetical protein